MAMSVNGMIADAKDGAPWSDAVRKAYLGTVEKYKNIIVGRRTYEIMTKAGDLDSFENKPSMIVVTSHPFVDSDTIQVPSLSEAIDHLRAQGFDSALIGGGSKLATSALQEDLVDEIQLDIEPILMARGIPLLQDSQFTAKLSLLEVNQLDDQVIHVTYSVRKDAV